MDLGIANRVALVCGASSGLGRAVAEALTREGVKVALNSRDRARLDETASALREHTGATVDVHPADVSEAADVDRLFADVASGLGRPDILFCNAGGPTGRCRVGGTRTPRSDPHGFVAAGDRWMGSHAPYQGQRGAEKYPDYRPYGPRHAGRRGKGPGVRLQ